MTIITVTANTPQTITASSMELPRIASSRSSHLDPGDTVVQEETDAHEDRRDDEGKATVVRSQQCVDVVATHDEHEPGGYKRQQSHHIARYAGRGRDYANVATQALSLANHGAHLRQHFNQVAAGAPLHRD